VISPQISLKPPSPQETEHKKREKERKIKKRKKKKKEKRKAPRVSSNKWEFNILIGEKQFNFKIPFSYDFIFSPSIIPF
jgi:hypothetical protein